MALVRLSSEQKLIESEVRKFSRTELEPIAADIDKEGVFPGSMVRKLSELGLSSIIIPEQYEGAGLDTTSLCVALEELSKACASLGTILAVNNCLVAYPLLHFAPEEKKAHYLRKLAHGAIGAYCFDVEIDVPKENVDMREGTDHYVVSGKKDFVLNGETAQFSIVPFSLPSGRMLFIVDNDKGMTVHKRELLGLRAAGIVGFECHNVVVAKDACLASENNALQETMDYAHVGFSAVALGIAEAAYDAAIKYSKERRQFGRAICEFPMIQEMLVDIKTKIEATRLLVYNAAAQCDLGSDFSLSAKMARLYSGDTAVFAGIKAVQVYGGYGYVKDYPVERFLRDAKTVQLLSETAMTIKEIIARTLLA